MKIDPAIIGFYKFLSFQTALPQPDFPEMTDSNPDFVKLVKKG